MKKWILILGLILFFPKIYSVNYVIHQINIEGNEFLTTQEIKNRLPYSSGNIFKIEYLKEISIAVKNIYESKNFFGVKIQHPKIEFLKDDNININLKINEGNQLLISEIKFSGLKYFSEVKLREKISKKKLRTINDLNKLLENIADIYNKREFLFVETRVDSLKKNENHFTAFVSIEEGKICNFEELIFEGNDITKPATILKISNFNQIKKITKESLELAEKKLSSRKYIKKSQLIPLDSQSLLFQIEEGHMTKFSGLLGYSDQERDKKGLTGFINLNFYNLFGSDRSLYVNWSHLTNYDNLIKFKYHESGPKNFSVAGDFSLIREKKDSTYIKTTFDSDIYYYFTNNKIGIYLGLDDYFPGTRRPIIVKTKQNKKLGIFWEYSNINFPNNPRKGQFLYTKYYHTFRKNETLQSSENALQNFIELPKNFVFANLATMNMIQNKNLDDEDLFNLGGFENLRGFTENQFQGYNIFCLNSELRYLISEKNRIYYFIDYGYVKNTQTTFSDLFGTGFGLSFSTKIGMLGINYALNYQNNKFQNISEGTIHFGVETDF